MVSGILAGMVPAAAAGDTSAPSVPQDHASADDSGSTYHYWVIVTVQAVDRALNRSAPSAAIEINVVG
jgi:hypothetical protein